MSALPLLLGVLAMAGGLVLAVLALTSSRAEHPGVAQVMAFYDRPATPAPTSPERELSGLLRRCRDLAVRVAPGGAPAKLQHGLDVAGNPAGWDADRVLAAKTLGALVVGVLGYLLSAPHGALVVVATPAAVAFGFVLPNVLVHNLGLKRQERMQKDLPDSMDMMTVCVEAGLGFDAALARVARNTTGPLAAEFARLLQEMQFGLSRVDALKAVGERTTVPEFKTLLSALVQASKLGIPVAAVMREQASEMRTRRRQRAEEQAQKVTVKILFPLMFCLLPALFVVVLGPGVINIVHALAAT